MPQPVSAAGLETGIVIMFAIEDTDILAPMLIVVGLLKKVSQYPAT